MFSGRTAAMTTWPSRNMKHRIVHSDCYVSARSSSLISVARRRRLEAPLSWTLDLGPSAKVKCPALSQPTERGMTKSRKKFDAACQAKSALEALREDAAVPELAKRLGVP